MAFQTNYVSSLTADLTTTGTTMSVLVAPIPTSGRICLQNGNIVEWVNYTGVAGLTLTGLTRSVSLTASPATGGATGLYWGAGTRVFMPAMHDQMVNPTDNITFVGTNTHSGAESFSGDVTATKSLRIPYFATAAARLAAIPSPTDGMVYYQNDVEEFYGYKNGAWQTLGSGGGGSAVWYQDSTGDGTITGAINGVNTTYVLSHTPGSVDAMILTYNGQVLERGATDDYTITASTITMNFAPVSGRLVAIYPDVGVGTQNATTRSTTGASSVNGELFRKSDDSNSLYYKDNAGDEVKLVDITSNKIPVASVDLTGANVTAYVDAATTSAAGIVELATDAEALAGTDQTRYVNPKQVKDNYQAKLTTRKFGTSSKTLTAGGSDTLSITHGFGKTPTFVRMVTYAAMQETYGAYACEGIQTGSTTSFITSGTRRVSSSTVPYVEAGTTTIIKMNTQDGGANSGDYISGTMTIGATTLDITFGYESYWDSKNLVILWEAFDA